MGSRIVQLADNGLRLVSWIAPGSKGAATDVWWITQSNEYSPSIAGARASPS